MKSSWISLCGLLAAAAAAALQPTYRHYSIRKCECNGRSQYCLPDAFGLHCLDCQGNTEGRRCERCKDGFFLQGAALSCTPCKCNLTGSVGAACDSRGRCSCRDGVSGEKCDRCPNGPIGPNGCTQRRQLRQDPGSGSPSCFCYGHSSTCSKASGFSVHNIASTFDHGPEDWKVATAQGLTPHDTVFRWSPKHQDVEVISRNSLPIYLYAPDRFLGNQLLSYGQNLSFSLRLDRGVRHPSTNDVILEGAGLRVGASLGDLRFIIPCGQKIHYSFRLDEQPSSKWRPQLSSAQFHTLLQNLTAVKIRSTFGETGRGYIDNVQLVSARPGSGVPARWVHTCSCPPEYEGTFCERCAAGFRRSAPADGAFSRCQPCSCRGGSCDPRTGDCYSADETPGERSCAEGFYRDPVRPDACVKCPCPDGVSCSLSAGSFLPRCDQCPPGTSGPNCDVCQEGFYGDPEGVFGVERPCQPCQCNGHIDLGIAGSCDRISGECLKCQNNTKGPSCESCVAGFYHSRPADACKACNCDAQRSESQQCDGSGQCRCRPGFEGQRCHRSSCPACFNPIKLKMEAYEDKLKDLETLVLNMDNGLKPANNAEMEAALRDAEELVNDLQDDTELLAELEKKLQGRLASISKSQLAEGQNIQDVADKADDIKDKHQTYNSKLKTVQMLLDEMKSKLEDAKSDLRSVDVPQSDAPAGSNPLSSLVQTATGLANNHETTADAVDQTANEALSNAKKGLSLVRDLMNRENKVKELIGDLKNTYDQTSAQVKGLENRAKTLSDEAKAESKAADGMLKDLTTLEKNIPPSLKGAMDAMVARMDGVKKAVDENISGLQELQDSVQQDTTDTQNLLATGKSAQKDADKLLARVNGAKAKTEGALQRINFNTNELDGALNALNGFDQQIDSAKALADAAIQRLPGINGTIQQAVASNDKTLSLFGDVSDDFSEAVNSIGQLDNLVRGIEGTIGSLPSHDSLASDAIRLNGEAYDLNNRAQGAARDFSLEWDKAMGLQDDADDAAVGAAAAFLNARQARDAVGKTLQNINNMLANMNKPGTVDEARLKQLEDSLANAQRDVEGSLRPRLASMNEKEAAQRRRLRAMNLDIDNILVDISNLEDILKSIPKGCFNSPPIEEA
ncbi:laminin subunit gamma-2 [Salarias fasciatus]|uniref:Laminin subunit gamma-2-like n=1 Tax=Salarias fasciatus TaxID=181472 RepID=A0A672HRH5_SALFA|nr:laminin subunit gamma-2-like [Salarias fasciatus]